MAMVTGNVHLRNHTKAPTRMIENVDLGNLYGLVVPHTMETSSTTKNKDMVKWCGQMGKFIKVVGT